LIFRKSVYMI